jgi:hypothetical protein
MSRVRLEGNLPPSIATIRMRRKGVLAGSVVDFQHHAVLGVPVVLQRRIGGRWLRISQSRTSQLGGYNFRTTKPGSYRVVATLSGRFSATSRPLRVKR